MSVIIATIGKSSLLSHVISQVSIQDHLLEILVIDDSKNKSDFKRIERCVQEFNHIPIRVIKSDSHGVSGARNTGIINCRGDLICFCDDDDVWYNHKVAYQVKSLHQNKCDIHFANFKKIDRSGGYDKHKDVNEVGLEYPANISLIGNVPPSGWMVCNYVFERVGLFDPYFDGTEDKDFLLRACSIFKYIQEGPHCFQYAISDGALSRELQTKYRNSFKLFNEYKDVLSMHPKESRSLVLFIFKVLIVCKKKNLVFLIMRFYIRSPGQSLAKVRVLGRALCYGLLRFKLKKSVS